MGVKATSRHSNLPCDNCESAITSHDTPTPGTRAAVPFCRAVERQPSQRRKVDSVLDDIMGDPDDFRDLAESDAESDGGRWENAVRAALEREEAGLGAAPPDTKNSEDGLSKTSGEDCLEPSGRRSSSPDHKHRASSLGAPGCSGQTGNDNTQENGWCKPSANALTIRSGSRESKVYRTKYFIIKSLNHHNIAKSIEKGIWATQAMNEPVLNEAFECAERVLLVFSVNMSGHFQGYAKMTSQIGQRRTDVWSKANEGANPWGGTFSVDWLRLYDLPFQKTVHLKNPLNFFKPVKISRDCQELTQDVGDALCGLIDDGADKEGRSNRKVTLADLAAVSARRKRKEPGSVSFSESQPRRTMGAKQGGGKSFSNIHPRNISAGNLQEPCASPRLPRRRPSERISRSASREGHAGSRSPRATCSGRNLYKERDDGRHKRIRGSENRMERDRSRDHTRSSSSHSADLPGEEDLLTMTYEQYLQRHGHSRAFNKSYQQDLGPMLCDSTSSGHNGRWTMRNAGSGFHADQYSGYIANWYSRQAQSMGGDPYYGRSVMGEESGVHRSHDSH